MIKKNISGWIYNFHIFLFLHSQCNLPPSIPRRPVPSHWVLCCVARTVDCNCAGSNVQCYQRGKEHLYIQGQILNFKCIASTRDNLFRILSAQRSRRDKLINPSNGQKLNTHVGESIENMPLFQTAYSFILIILYSFLSFYPSQLISVTPAKDKQDILDSWIEDRTFFTQ